MSIRDMRNSIIDERDTAIQDHDRVAVVLATDVAYMLTRFMKRHKVRMIPSQLQKDIRTAYLTNHCRNSEHNRDKMVMAYCELRLLYTKLLEEEAK
jgi:hypothetical protein